ncbi:unnamed protein product (mitochondrion) [Plasmodiophora brassicae]|uniref:Uncharacterized protein n=1 Tax=Plasmodiophora brassicae TaxID=37360 RepID=A0A3P3Y2S1_PLABS|nr:unnamed protein product [Plasmodiophora brassicae]
MSRAVENMARELEGVRRRANDVAREIELLVVQRAKLAHPDDMTMPVAPSSSAIEAKRLREQIRRVQEETRGVRDRQRTIEERFETHSAIISAYVQHVRDQMLAEMKADGIREKRDSLERCLIQARAELAEIRSRQADLHRQAEEKQAQEREREQVSRSVRELIQSAHDWKQQRNRLKIATNQRNALAKRVLAVTKNQPDTDVPTETEKPKSQHRAVGKRKTPTGYCTSSSAVRQQRPCKQPSNPLPAPCGESAMFFD